MLGPPVALPRFSDGLLVRLDAWIAQLGQHGRIVLSAQNGVQTRHPRLAGEVADDVLKLHIHLRERLLHVLHMLTGHLHQIVAVPHERAHGTHFALWTERRMQQAQRVQMLDPLALVEIGAFARHVFHVPRIYQTRLDAMPLHSLIHWHPIHPGGLHRHRGDSTTHQPFRHLVQITGESPAPADGMWVPVWRHSYVDLPGPDVDSTRIRLKRRIDYL